MYWIYSASAFVYSVDMTYLGIFDEADVPLYKRVSNHVETVESEASSGDESSDER